MQGVVKVIPNTIGLFLDDLQVLCVKHSVDIFLLGGDSGILHKNLTEGIETLAENVEIIDGVISVGKIFTGNL